MQLKCQPVYNIYVFIVEKRQRKNYIQILIEDTAHGLAYILQQLKINLGRKNGSCDLKPLFWDGYKYHLTVLMDKIPWWIT